MKSKQTPTRMARLVAQWQQSGESQSSFARRHRISGWTFWYWCRKLADAPEADHESTPTTTFVPVHLAEAPVTPVVDIVVPGGEQLHVRAGASADLLRAVVTALRAGC